MVQQVWALVEGPVREMASQGFLAVFSTDPRVCKGLAAVAFLDGGLFVRVNLRVWAFGRAPNTR